MSNEMYIFMFSGTRDRVNTFLKYFEFLNTRKYANQRPPLLKKTFFADISVTRQANVANEVSIPMFQGQEM